MLTTVLLFLTVQVSGVSNNVLFVDEFDNEKLPGWDVSDTIPPGDVKVKNGKLLLGNNGTLTIDVRKSDTWMDYTTTLRLRFLETQQGCTFRIVVRHSLGRFNFWTNQQFVFSPHKGEIQVYTVRPEKQPREKAKMPASAEYNFKRSKWYHLAIEIIDNRFTLFIDEQELLSFKDRGTLPGTVSISTGHTFKWWNGEPAGKIRMEIDYIRVAVKRLGFVKRLGPSGTTLTTWATIKNARLEER